MIGDIYTAIGEVVQEDAHLFRFVSVSCTSHNGTGVYLPKRSLPFHHHYTLALDGVLIKPGNPTSLWNKKRRAFLLQGSRLAYVDTWAAFGDAPGDNLGDRRRDRLLVFLLWLTVVVGTAGRLQRLSEEPRN